MKAMLILLDFSASLLRYVYQLVLFSVCLSVCVYANRQKVVLKT